MFSACERRVGPDLRDQHRHHRVCEDLPIIGDSDDWRKRVVGQRRGRGTSGPRYPAFSRSISCWKVSA